VVFALGFQGGEIAFSLSSVRAPLLKAWRDFLSPLPHTLFFVELRIVNRCFFIAAPTHFILVIVGVSEHVLSTRR